MERVGNHLIIFLGQGCDQIRILTSNTNTNTPDFKMSNTNTNTNTPDFKMPNTNTNTGGKIQIQLQIHQPLNSKYRYWRSNINTLFSILRNRDKTKVKSSNNSNP